MEEKQVTVGSQWKNSHFKSLAIFLKQPSKRINFRLSDWLRTLDNEDLDRLLRDANSIYESLRKGTPATRHSKDLAKAACLAYGAEEPTIGAELIIQRLDLLIIGMSNVAYIELVSRCGWVVMTDRRICRVVDKPTEFSGKALCRSN